MSYTRIATYGSRSNPSARPYEVSWSHDERRLTCPCPGWTRRTGTGGSRTCRHVEDVAARVTSLGGIDRVLDILRGGQRLYEEVHARAVPQPPVRVPMVPPQHVARARRARPTARPDPPRDPILVAAQELAARIVLGRMSQIGVASEIAAVIRRFAGSAAPVVATPAMPDWLGGERAIILRE